MFEQLPPFSLQRRHCRLISVGLPDQRPSVAVNVDPTCAVPVICGGSIFAGRTVFAACPSSLTIPTPTAMARHTTTPPISLKRSFMACPLLTGVGRKHDPRCMFPFLLQNEHFFACSLERGTR